METTSQMTEDNEVAIADNKGVVKQPPGVEVPRVPSYPGSLSSPPTKNPAERERNAASSPMPDGQDGIPDGPPVVVVSKTYTSGVSEDKTAEIKVAEEPPPAQIKTKGSGSTKPGVSVCMEAEQIDIPENKTNPDSPARAKSSASTLSSATVSSHGLQLQIAKLHELPDGEKDAMRPLHYILLFLSIALPNAVLVIMFSDIGYGTDLFNLFAPANFSLMGDGAVSSATLVIFVLLVCDWWVMPFPIQLVTALLPLAIYYVGSLLKGRKYPYAPMLLTLLFMPGLAGALRLTLCATVRRKSFYTALSVMCFLSALAVGILWVVFIVVDDSGWSVSTKIRLAAETHKVYENVYTDTTLVYGVHCGPDKDEALLARLYSSKDQAKIQTACTSASTLWFLIWMCPFIALCTDLITCLFALVMGVFGSIDSVPNVQRNIFKFLVIVGVLLSGMLATASLSATSLALGSTVLAFFTAALCLVCVWAYVEVDPELLQLAANTSKLLQQMHKLWQSDWVKALGLSAVCVPLAAFFVGNRLCQKFRKFRGVEELYAENAELLPGTLVRIGMDSMNEIGIVQRVRRDPVTKEITGDVQVLFPSKKEEVKVKAADLTKLPGKYTPKAQGINFEMSKWRWTSILVKLCLLWELFFTLQVGVSKVTYIFLSWLNTLLKPVEIQYVIVIVYFVGGTMFLLPPVPGLPVYIFAGILLGEKGNQNEAVGFWGGCVIAMVLGLFTKVCACVGQYMIGYFLGKSVKVQQLIGVDKVPTRAIEKILKSRGLNAGKVSVLVGGPDWPTSVTCGIVGVNIPQMLLGTLPVVSLLAPCVVAGACMGRVTPGENNTWSMGANAAIMVSAGVNMASSAYAVYTVGHIIERDGEALSQPRAEHAAVEALTKQEAEEVAVYDRVSDFSNLPMSLRVLLVLAAGGLLLSNVSLYALSELCFRTFAVSSKINDPEDLDGLDGNVVNIVRLPTGAIALCLFFVACVLHILFAKCVGKMAKAEFRKLGK